MENLKVIIPCAGRGTRMYPATKNCPKVLLEHNGRPILDQIIDSVCDVVDHPTFIIVNSPRFNNMMLDHILKIRDGRFDAIFVIQEEPLGFGHAVLQARKLAVGEPVMIHASDKILDFTDMDCSESWMAVRRIEPPIFVGVIDVKDGYTTAMIEKPSVCWNAVCYIKETGSMFDILDDIVETDLKTVGEYQMADALAGMITVGILIKAVSFSTIYTEYHEEIHAEIID